MTDSIIEYERIEARLNDGTVVLGKLYKGEPSAKTYANRTQARTAADREPDGYVIQRGRPFYVGLAWRNK